jgi:hypothetical protein
LQGRGFNTQKTIENLPTATWICSSSVAQNVMPSSAATVVSAGFSAAMPATWVLVPPKPKEDRPKLFRVSCFGGQSLESGGYTHTYIYIYIYNYIYIHKCDIVQICM